MVTDRFSKMVHLIPFGDDTTAETMARRFYAEVVRLHGLPSSIISDRDPRWMSTFWTDLFHLMGVELKRSTAFHPETDGQSERSIRTVCEMLRAHAVAKSIEWVDCLPAVELHYNATVQRSTGKSPFEIVYGREA